MAANLELLALHWDVGRMILDRQQAEGWGAKVIDRLAVDLQREFPGGRDSRPGTSNTRAFAEAWPDVQFVQPAVAQLMTGPIGQRPAAQLSAKESAEGAQRGGAHSC